MITGDGHMIFCDGHFDLLYSGSRGNPCRGDGSANH